MMLLTKANRKALPPLYSQDDKGDDAIAYVKFFTPDSNWTWYAMEGEPTLKAGIETNFTFFGYVVGHFPELGYFCLSDLKSARGPLGLPVERDRHFKPTTLGEIKRRHNL